VLDQRAWALLRRLTRWLNQFKGCFGHRAQRVSLRVYVDGLLSDSPRKSMAAMLARVTEPASYQALQQFITDAPWDAEAVWRQLRAVLPARTGVLILDETSFPKQGPHSVATARQYCGALGKVALCQVAVTAALWTGGRAWPLGVLLYVPASWTNDVARRSATRIPAGLVFQEKWRLALTLWRRIRASGLRVTAVVADAEYGDNGTVRQVFHRARVPYAFGISPTLTVFRGTPTFPVNRQARRPRNRRGGWPDHDPVTVRAFSDAVPAAAWCRVSWRNGTNPPWAADFVAARVTPANEWRHRRLPPEIWLLCERGLGPTGRRKHYFVSLPARASLHQIVRLAHQRWAIEQHYQDLKTELGLDHFEGRTYPGWQHHMVISAVAYTFLQKERLRRPVDRALTFPAVRAIVQEVFTGLLFASRPTYMKWLNQAQLKHQLRI
jgi:SRSO17 transposase